METEIFHAGCFLWYIFSFLFFFFSSFKFCFIKTNSLKMEAKIDQKEKEVASVWWGNEHWWINTLQLFLKYPG